MSVKEIKSEPNKVVIEILKDLLVRAESGNIHGIAAIVEHSGCSANVFSVYNPVVALGELAILQRDIIDTQIDLRCPVSEEE